MSSRIPSLALNLGAISRGAVISLLVALVLSGSVGTMLYFTHVQEIWMAAIATAVMVLSILTGSMVASQKAGHKGLLHGFIVALFFFILTLILTIPLASHFSLLVALKKLLFALVAGGFGGILGVGFSK